MENNENNPEISKEREKNELDYHAWLEDIYNEIRNVHLKATCFHGNVLKLMDRFIDYFRIYLRKNPPDKSKTMHDFYLARATSRIILLFRDLITEENDHEYLHRICELLGGSTVLWIRYYSYIDQESGEAHIESILNSYAFYLQSTTDESFLLKIFAHVLLANKKLPEIFSTILEKFLIMRVQRQGRRDQETKEDQLYILYIIAFKQWEILRRQNVGITDIPKYANDFMKPMISILSNHRYVLYLPAITPNDIEEGKATRIILRKFQMRYLSRLTEATIKQDWLRGSDINTPITVDLSIEDDVNQSELVEVNPIDSVNQEVENLSINRTNVTLSKELWWVQILQIKAMKNLKNRTNNYKVVEVIEIDDKEDDEICEAVNDTTTLSTTVEDTQSKTELQKDNTDNRMQPEIVNKEDRAKMLEEELQVSGIETNIEIQNETIEQEMNDGENVSTSEENINKTEEELIGNAGTCSNQPDKYEKMDTKQSKKKDENFIDTSTSTGSFNRSILKVYKGPTSSKSKIRNLIELPTNRITLENSDIDLEKGDVDEIPKEIVNTNDNELIDPIEKNSEIPSVISEEMHSVISEQTLKDTHKKINEEEVTDTISNARNEVSINDEILDKLDEESVIRKKGEDERRNAENKKEARTKNKNKTGKQEVMDKSKSIIEEKMDITIENRVTSKENSGENISTFVSTSEELHSPISSALPEDNEKCDNSNLTTNEHNNELLEISSADTERHIQNRDNDEEEIGKTIEDFASDEDINLTASIPRNVSAPNSNTLTELEQNSSEDEEAISIICIEETKLRSPINFSERNVSTQTEITGDEINIKHNLIIDQLETSKSTKTKVYEKKHQNKNKEFSEHQVSNKNEYIPFKNADVAEKESEENDATIQRAEAETTIPPQSLKDDDRSSISSIVESKTYEIIDPKTDDIHIEKIKPIKITETGNRKKPDQENCIFSIATDKKLSSCTNFENKFPEESAQSNRVIFNTNTVHIRKKRSISPEYSFFPIRDSFESIHGEMDEIKSPSVESFSKSDTAEFKKLFNNTYKDSLQADDESCTEEEEEDEYSMANSCFLNSPTISKRTNKVVPKPSILCKKESISTTVKRKAVSFAPIPQHKKSPLMANRSVNFDSTIIERKTYDSSLTIETEPQIWKSSINTTSISNQHEQSTNEHELDNILSTSDINCFGSPSPSLIKDSGMTQNMFQFESDSQLSVFNDDAVGNNSEILPNKSCESDNNLVSATDLSTTNSGTLKVKTDLMTSDIGASSPSPQSQLNSELNNIEEESINMILEYIGDDECDNNKPEEKKIQYSLPLKKRRTLSRDSASLFEEACKGNNDKKPFEYYDYDKNIAYPAERCMSILQVFDEKVTLLLNSNRNNSTIAIINGPPQQTILTDGRGFNVISQQKNTPPTSTANIYTNIPLQTEMNSFNNDGIKLNTENNTQHPGGNVYQNVNSPNKLNNLEYLLNTENIYNNPYTMYNQNTESANKMNSFDYSLNSNYNHLPHSNNNNNSHRNIGQNTATSSRDKNNLNYGVNSHNTGMRNPQGGNICRNVEPSFDVNKFNYTQNSNNLPNNIQHNIESSASDINKFNYSINSGNMANNSSYPREYITKDKDARKLANEQLIGINLSHYDLKYEHMSNYYHNNQINLAKKRALLQGDDDTGVVFFLQSKHDTTAQQLFPTNVRKHLKQTKRKCEESRGKQRKSKNLVTDRITRSSNRTKSVNYTYKDDGLPESKTRKRKYCFVNRKA